MPKTSPITPPSESELRTIITVLAQTYGSPRHGNMDDPLDELIFIIISTRTQDARFRATFAELKSGYTSWESLTKGEIREVEHILAPAGLAHRKAHQIIDLLERLRVTFGTATLSPISNIPVLEAEDFLTSLPGVGLKVAKCVLMYALGRNVLPVDTHVYRLAFRLGLPTKGRPDTSQEILERAVPPDLRYALHVNAVAHGRSVCLPTNPKCSVCCISPWCQRRGVQPGHISQTAGKRRAVSSKGRE